MAAPIQTSPTRVEAAALLAQLQTVRTAIEDAITRAQRSSAQSSLAATLSTVTGMEAALAQALQGGGSLAGIDLAAVARPIAGSQSTLNAAETARVTDSAAANLVATSAATRQEVQTLSHDLFTRRIFDPYLHFASAEDEAAYRTRAGGDGGGGVGSRLSPFADF